MSDLPLKARLAIRDSWEKEDAGVRKSLKALRDVLGVDIDVEPEWKILFAELEKVYEDKSELVIQVATCVQAWTNGLAALIDDESNAEWGDELVEKINGRARVFFEVIKGQEPALSWSDERRAFIIALPKSRLLSPVLMESSFKTTFLQCFKEQPVTTPLTQRPGPPGDDWADVSMDTVTGTPAVVEKPLPRPPAASSGREYDVLPDFGTLARPDDLLLKPPYHLTVSGGSGTYVEVQCSHSPTLQFLAEYLKKWCKVNNQDSRKPPCIDVKLHQSAFGLGLVYDKLTLQGESRWNQYTATPMIILSLVEGVLGYQSVKAEDGRWVYRRDIELRRYG